MATAVVYYYYMPSAILNLFVLSETPSITIRNSEDTVGLLQILLSALSTVFATCSSLLVYTRRKIRINIFGLSYLSYITDRSVFKKTVPIIMSLFIFRL